MKFKLKIVQILALGCLAAPITFTSCSQDRMDEINQNVNNPTDVTAKFILADVITSTAVFKLLAALFTLQPLPSQKKYE